MADKRKIPIDDDSSAKKASDEQSSGAETASEEVMTDSPGERDLVAESTLEEVLPEDVVALKARCEQAEKRAEEEHENFLRALADFNNYRRRAKEEIRQAREFATEDFIVRLLPILDNFERAIAAAEQTKDFDSLHGGVILILRQLRDLLSKEGVEPIHAVGEQFDPMKHEAVMRVDTSDYPDNTVLEEVRTGYTMKGKVIRPSAVKVSRHVEHGPEHE